MSTEESVKAVLHKPGPREIVTEREFAATPERVWRAFTDPELVPRWWGPGSSSTPSSTPPRNATR